MRTIPTNVIREIVKTAVIKGLNDDVPWDEIDYFIITPDGEYIGIDKDDNKMPEAKFSIVATRIKSD